MPVTIKITVSENAGAILKNLQTMPAWLGARVVKSMDLQNQLTVGHIQQDYLSFPRGEPPVKIGCRVITNRLRGSIRASKAEISGKQVVSAIGSNVEYAAAQEFGADIPARKITAKNGKALRFMIGDRVIFAKSVNLPAMRLEARAFVQRGIADRAQQYSDAFTKAVVEGWNQNGAN